MAFPVAVASRNAVTLVALPSGDVIVALMALEDEEDPTSMMGAVEELVLALSTAASADSSDDVAQEEVNDGRLTTEIVGGPP